jgi:hypothetical protein
VASLGPADRTLALLAETVGDVEAADGYAASAEAWCRATGCTPYLALVLSEAAARHWDDDRPSAERWLAEAGDLGVDMGSALIARRVKRLAGEGDGA